VKQRMKDIFENTSVAEVSSEMGRQGLRLTDSA
jgi:hypothetical protein